jgi:deoxyribodipyrimidine photolyase
MTDKQNAAIYEHYTTAIKSWRELAPQQRSQAPAPQWQDSRKALGIITKAEADAELKKAKAEVAAAEAGETAAEAEASAVKQN